MTGNYKYPNNPPEERQYYVKYRVRNDNSGHWQETAPMVKQMADGLAEDLKDWYDNVTVEKVSKVLKITAVNRKVLRCNRKGIGLRIRKYL